MKIAVTYEDGKVFQHFGHTEHFKIYRIDGDKVAESMAIGTDGNGHGALAGFLKGQGVDVLICGGIGAGAKQALADAGIKLYGGVSGGADRAVEELLDGTLAHDPDVSCSHHGEDQTHGEGHSCGHHVR